MALSKNRTLDLLRESYYSNYSKYNLQGSIKSPATKSVVFKDDEEKKKKDNTFWQDTGDFFEGVGYLGYKAGLGFINSLEGTVDYLSSGIAKIFGGDELAEKILENDWLDYDAADDWFNPGQGWKIAGDVAGGIGTSLFSIGTGLFTGGAGVVISAGLSGAGNAARESYKESGKYGLNEFLYSSSVGALEGGLEAVLGAGTKWAKSLAKSMGLSIGKNAAKNAGKVVATTAKSALKKAGTEMFSEGMEEAITEFVSPYIKRVTYDKNAANATADEILYAGLVGGLSGLVMSGSVGAINQAGNIRKGNAIVKDGRASSVASLAETLVNVDKNSKYNKAIGDIYNRIAPAVNSGEKLNLNQRRALGELLQLETAAVFEPVIKRSAISVINSAEAVATRLNEYGTYKIVDGKLVNVKDSSFDISGAEVRDITAEDITRGVVFENGKMLDTQSVADALQNNDVLRLVSASDAAGRLMMNAKETERAASFGSKIRSQEELRAFVAESTQEEKAALAKELQIEDLDSVGFEEFNQKALEYRESGKAEQFQERIRTKEQLQRLSVDNAKRMPIEIHLADGEMKRYSDGDSNISVVRNGNEYIVYDFKNGTLSQPLTKKRLDKILQRKKQIKKTQASDDKALALYEEKLQKKYDKDAPLREARARILAQMGVREETTVPNLNPDAKPQMNGVSPPNIEQNVAQNENAESNADLNTVTQSDASPYENYTNNESSENAGKKSRGLMPLLESIADSFSSIGSSKGIDKTKSLRSVPSDERGAVMQPASETEADTTKNEDGQSNEKGETRSLLGVDAAKKFAESINAYRNAKNIAQEKIADFDKMDDAKKEKTVSVLKNAVKKGISAEDATMYARVSARSGLDIVFDKEACLRKVNGEEVYAAGFYDPENNRIVVNPDAKKKHASLLIHELSHAIRSYVGKDNKIHYISDKNAKISDELWEKVKKHYSDQNVDVTRTELMLDEASAYYAEEILGTDAAIDLLLGKKKTLKEKILSFFKGAARDYSGDAALSKEARKFFRSFKQTFDAFAEKNQMAEANVQKEDADKTKISGNTSDARFSLEFADKIAEDQRKYIKDHSQAITESELNKAIKDTDEMVDTMIEHKKILPEDKVGKTLVKNGSYDVSVENTTICVRTLSYNTFVDMVSEKIGRPLSQMESFLVSQKLYDIAKEPQCLYCYVSLDRKAYNDMILRYIDQRDAAIKAYEEAGRPNVTRSSKLYEDFRNKRADTDSMWDRYKGWIDAYKKGEKLLTAKDVATEARRVALVEGKDASAAAQVKDILKYAQSASWAKKQTKYVAYNGEILKLGNNVIKNLNKHYGLRWYSFSDYSGAFIVENMQQITDASLRGLKGLSYTKDTDFAKIFAPTGMNINISVYATKDGKGGYTIDEKQSANIDEAIALRKKYPNVGIVVVATDTAGVEWALDQKWSDVVIPFHTVRTGQQVAEFYDWTVFNEEQNDSVKNENLWNEYVRNVTKGDAKASKKVSKMVYPSEHQNNRETYLRLIEERGLKPRFASFLDNPNYMKLVNETRQSESQTSPLKPVYDVDAAKQSFDKFVDKGGYYEGWYNDGIDVDGEAEIVASDIRAGKKANEVDYGRQDQRGNPTPSPEAIMAQRKTKRSHGENVRFAANIDNFASSHDISWRNVAYEDSETKAKITSDIHNKMVAEGLIVKIPDEIKSKVKESYPDLQGMKKKERLPILKDSIKQLKTNLRTFLTKLKGNTFEFEVDGDVLEAKLYNVGIDEVLEKVTQDKAEMLYTTEEIFKNSRYLYSTPDYDGDPNIYRWNYFYTPVQLGENIVGVRIAIRDMVKQGESQIYNWGIKKDTSLGGVRDDYINRKSNDASSDVSSDIIIPDSAEKVNTSEKSSTDSGKRFSIDEESFESPTLGNVAKSRFDEPKPKMKEKIKASFISAKDKLYIEGVDELYGVEKYLKKFGGRKDAPEFLQQVRASETIAQSMIGVAQYDITNGDGTRLGDGITKIFKPYNTRKIANQFNDYLLHQLNVDRMSLHETSLNMKKELEAAFKKAKMAYDAAEKRMKSGEIKSIPDNITKKYNSAKLAFESYEVIEDKPVFDKNETREKAITAEESKKIIAEYEKKYPSFKEDAEKVWNYSKNLLNMRVNAGLISQSSADLMMRYYPHYVPSFRENKKSVGAGTVKNNSQLAVNSTVKRAKGGGEDIYSIEESLAAQTRQAIRAMKINEMANAVYDAAIKSGDTSYVIAEEVDTETNTDPDKDVDVDLIPKNNQIAFLKNGKRIEMNVSQEIFDGFKGVTSGSVPDMFVARMASGGVNLFKNLVTSYSPAFSVRNIVRDVQDALINSRHSALFSKNVLLAINGIIKNDALWQKYLAYGGYASTVFDAKGFTNGVGGRGFESFVKLSEIDGNTLKKLPEAAKNILVGIGNANAFVEQVTRFAEFRASIEAGDSIQTAINNSADVTTNFSRHGKTVKVLNATFIPFLNASVQGFDKLYRTLTDPIREKSLKALAMLLAKIFTVGVGFQIINMIMNADDEDYYDLTDEVRENYFLIKVGDQFLKIPRGRAAAAFGGIANRIGNEMRGDDFDVSGYLKSLKDNVTPVDSFSRNILSPLNDVATNTTWYGGEIEGRQFDNVRPSQRYDESTSSIAIWIGDKFNYSPKKIHYLMDQYSGVIGDFLLPMTSKKAEKDYLSANFLIDSSTNNKLSGDFYKLYDEATYATEEGDMTAYYQLRHLNDVKDSVSKIYKEINEIQASDMKSTEKLQQVRTLRILVNNLYRTAALDYDTYTKAIEATEGMFDDSNASGKRDRHVAITKMTFGSEKALEEYNATVYEKSTLFNKAGISYDTYYEYYFSVRDLESDLDRKGEVIEGSKRKKVIQAINDLDASVNEKLLMICASGYAIKDGDIRGYSAERAKRMLYRTIKTMNVSEEERIKLAEACGFKVKNGRILIN
jgi:hypothetical protein